MGLDAIYWVLLDDMRPFRHYRLDVSRNFLSIIQLA